MENDRSSMVFYRSFYEAVKDLPEDVKLMVYNAIFQFSFDGVEPDLQGFPRSIFTLIKPQLEANYKRYMNGKAVKNKAKRKQNGSKTEAKRKQTGNKEVTNVNVNVNVNEECSSSNDDKILFDGVFSYKLIPQPALDRIVDEALRYKLPENKVATLLDYMDKREKHVLVRDEGVIPGLMDIVKLIK